MEQDMYGFRAFVFDGKKTAQKALDTLEEFTPAYRWVDNVALISRNKLGSIKVHSTWAQNNESEKGAGFGAFTGGLIGLLLGPGGALAGLAIGGSVGALIGTSEEMAFSDPRLDDFAVALKNNTSALILVAEEDTLASFADAVTPYGGTIIDTNLNEKDVKALKKVLKSI